MQITCRRLGASASSGNFQESCGRSISAERSISTAANTAEIFAGARLKIDSVAGIVFPLTDKGRTDSGRRTHVRGGNRCRGLYRRNRWPGRAGGTGAEESRFPFMQEYAAIYWTHIRSNSGRYCEKRGRRELADLQAYAVNAVWRYGTAGDLRACALCAGQTGSAAARPGRKQCICGAE